jgi:hypothetical protein
MRVLVRQDPAIDLCDIDTFQRAVNDNEDLGVWVTKDGCPVCVEFDEVVNKINGEVDTPLVAIDLEADEANDPCSKLADHLKVTHTPTFIRYLGGKESGRLVASGDPMKDYEALKALLKS